MKKMIDNFSILWYYNTAGNEKRSTIWKRRNEKWVQNLLKNG